MNKRLMGLLLATLVVGSLTAKTNRTFLMPRSHGVNLPSTTFNELIATDSEDRFGANFQLTGFYQEASDKSDLGKYFGVNNKDNVQLRRDTTINVTDVNLYYIIHDYSNSVNDVTGNNSQIKLSPDQTAAGVRIDYYQDLEKITKGLYFKVAVPIVHVKNSIDLSLTTSDLNSTLISYFKGNYSQSANSMNGQVTLNKAKIDGSQSSTGVADIDFVLGYKVDKEKYYFGVNAGLTIPTGDTPDGEWLFEPVVGNGNHWAIGGGLDICGKLWEKEDQSIKVTGVVNYRYLFESTEMRTLGLKSKNWGQYYLIAKVDDKQLTPAANELTMNVDVTPGGQLDAIMYFTYNYKNFTFDLGYNLFWKDTEDVSIKNWDDDAGWGLVYRSYLGTTAVADGNFDTGAGANAASLATSFQITKDNIDVTVAESPSQVTQKIYGGAGYVFKDWEYPFMVGIGGAYEFANEDAIENWQLWGKIGVAF